MKAASLVEAFGREAGVALSLNAKGTASLCFENGLVLFLESDPLDDALHVYAVIGREPVDAVQRKAMLAHLMLGNLLGRDMAGASFGLHAPTGDVILAQRLALDRADTAALRAVVAAMAPAAMRWQQKLAEAAVDTPPSAPLAGSIPPGFGSHV